MSTNEPQFNAQPAAPTSLDLGGAAAAVAPTPLAPPSLSLEPAAPVGQVTQTQAPKMAPAIEAAQVPVLDAKVDQFMTALSGAQAGSPTFNAQADAVRTMGDQDIRKAAESSNRLLQTPVKALKEGGLSSNSNVGKTLLDLRRTVEDLDPSQAKGVKKVLGFLPFGKDVQSYFRKYESSQDHLNGILTALRNGQDELLRDNVALNMEKQNLWQIMGRLNQYTYIAERLDAKLSAEIAQWQLTDPEKAKVMSQDVLFYVRQKHQDLLTQLAVSIQSYLAIDVIIKNNLELIKGVDRASTTTVSALRTAVIVAQALGNQQLVLTQITELNRTTSSLIERTSEMLKDNSARIQEQAATSMIGIEQLQHAFANIYETMDSIDNFKLAALNNMSQTIGVLENEVAKSKSYLNRVNRNDVQAAVNFALNDGSNGPTMGPIGNPAQH
ncbi:MAG: toxic anion resistance protein [Propionibacteriaceae bacterium]